MAPGFMATVLMAAVLMATVLCVGRVELLGVELRISAILS